MTKIRFQQGICYFGDCLEVMSTFPEKKVDLILADLPYGTTRNKWDSIIPFVDLWAYYNRVMKENGAIVLTSMQPFTSSLINSNLRNFKYCWYWKKNRATGVLNAKKQPLRNIEEICVFNVKQYNPQGLVVYGEQSRNGKKESDNYGKGKTNVYTQEFTNYPKQLLEFDSVQRVIHPTQKPVSLFEYLIKTYTNKGGLVLDNCAGSFTTSIACINTDRYFLCIENNETYFNKGVERIRNHISK